MINTENMETLNDIKNNITYLKKQSSSINKNLFKRISNNFYKWFIKDSKKCTYVKPKI